MRQSKRPPIKSRSDQNKDRKKKLDTWARARSDAKSNVSEYKT